MHLFHKYKNSNAIKILWSEEKSMQRKKNQNVHQHEVQNSYFGRAIYIPIYVGMCFTRSDENVRSHICYLYYQIHKLCWRRCKVG